MQAELMPKRLELLLEVVPQARVIALLSNPDELSTERIIGHTQEAARAKRVDLRVLKARTESDIDWHSRPSSSCEPMGSSLAASAFGPRS
jgi:putative ABC transport system substrate-binding protein